MNENFTKLNRKQFIKMWRTMKAESGDRRTHIMPGLDEATIRELMNRYEARIVLDRVLNRKWWRLW